MHGTIYVSVYMEAHRRSQSDRERLEAMQWRIRITNALRCYRAAHTREEKQEIVKFYKEEFTKLGWKISQ